MSAFMSGSLAAGPDPFTVIPGLGDVGVRGVANADRPGAEGIPFEGLLAGFTKGEADLGHATDVTEPTHPLAEDGAEVPEDLAALLLGTVNARLRQAEVPEGGESERIRLGDAEPVSTAAGGSTRTAPTADLATPLPVDPSKLHPELQERLARVIERMQAEFGHAVQVTEGFRTPERQAQLYAQGRTQPGPVVTWTRDSAHTQGLAADVIIDGTYDNPVAYQRFAQLAQQEGLKSLAPLDPGHVELDAEGLGLSSFGSTIAVTDVRSDIARPTRVATVAEVAEPARPSVIAQVAAVVRPAEVARPATVATIARPASPGEAVAPAPTPDNGVRLAASGVEPAAVEGDAPQLALGIDRPLRATLPEPGTEQPLRRAFESRVADRTEATWGEGSFVAPGRTEVDPRSLTTPLTASGEALRAPEFPQVATPVARTESMERAQRVRELLEAARRPVQQVTLAVDAGTGEEALMKVSLRDGRVSTSIGVRDPFSAERLAAESTALRASLVRQGLEAGAVDVRTILPTLEAGGGSSSRRDGQNPFIPGLGEPLDGRSGEEGGANARSRGYWESLNRERDRLFGAREGSR